MNTRELNQVLSDEIHKLRSGKAKPDRTKAITQAASQIIAAARLELSYARLVGLKSPTLAFFSNGKALPAPKKNGHAKR